jgi:hypothetical protein
MVTMSDFTLPDGTIKWVEYEKAQINNGDRCKACHHAISPGYGTPRLCQQCEELERNHGVVWHDRVVRCPECRQLINVVDGHYVSDTDGKHDIQCPECECEFEIFVKTTYSFSSPSLKKAE